MKKAGKVLALALGCGLAFGGLVACSKKNTDEIIVYMPDGAPVLAMAQMLVEDTAEDGVTYRVAAANAISSQVTYTDMDKNADLCVLPVNAAAKLLGSGENYTMLGGVTHGNLYLISKNNTPITGENIASLVGKKVGVLQMNAVPGLTFKATLDKLGIPYQTMENDGGLAEDKVNLVAITGIPDISVTPAEYYLLAAPNLAVKDYSVVGDLQTLYGGENGYPQAVLVAKNAVLSAKESFVKAFAKKLENAQAWLAAADGAEIVSAVNANLDKTLSSTSLTAEKIDEWKDYCGVRYEYAAAMQERTQAFLAELIAVNAASTALPNAAFYWSYTK